MDLKQITAKDLSALVRSEIVQVRGISGAMTTVEIAKQAAELTQMHAMSGLVYNIVAYLPDLSTFYVERVQ